MKSRAWINFFSAAIFALVSFWGFQPLALLAQGISPPVTGQLFQATAHPELALRIQPAENIKVGETVTFTIRAPSPPLQESIQTKPWVLHIRPFSGGTLDVPMPNGVAASRDGDYRFEAAEARPETDPGVIDQGQPPTTHRSCPGMNKPRA